MKFEIELDDDMWSALVLISQGNNDKTPAITVKKMIFEHVRSFLTGKIAGLQESRGIIGTGPAPSKAEDQRRAGLRNAPKP